MFSSRILATLILSLVIATASRANALTITSCGTSIPDAEVGTLGADLTCTDLAPAITLGAGSTLQLGGHRVQGISADGDTNIAVVKCTTTKCRIVGPGEIVGSDGVGSYGQCVAGPQDGRLQMKAGGQGGIDIHDCSNGILAARADIEDVTAHGCVIGVYAGRARLKNVDVWDNVAGVWTQRGKLRNVKAHANSGFGIIGAGVSKIRLIGSNVRENGDAGVIGDRLKLRDTAFFGNNGYGQSIDVASFGTPELENVACLKSGRLPERYTSTPPALEGTWSVCRGD